MLGEKGDNLYLPFSLIGYVIDWLIILSQLRLFHE